MKNLTKKMKIIIASVVAVICVVSIAVGVILINKNKPNDPYTPPCVDPNGWIISGNGTSGIGGGNSSGSGSGNSGTQLSSWSDKFDALGNEMNKLLESESYNEYKIYESVPYTDYVNADNKLTQFTDKYFSVSGEDGLKYYVYEKNSAGNFVVTDICAKKQDGGVIDNSATNVYISAYNDCFVSIISILENGDNVLTILDCENKAVVFEYILKKSEGSHFEKFYFSELNQFGYIIVYTPEGDLIFLVDIANGKLSKINDFIDSETNSHNILDTADIIIFNEGLLIEIDKVCYLYSIENGTLLKNIFTLESNQEINYIRTITNNQFVIEFKKSIPAIDKISTSIYEDEVYYEYTYKLGEVTTSAVILSEIQKSEGVAQLDICAIGFSYNFYLKRELFTNQSNGLKDEEKVTYYYKDGSEVVSFNTRLKTEVIVKISGKNVLTESRLVKFTSATEFTTLVDLGTHKITSGEYGPEMPKNEYIISSTEFYSDKFLTFKISDDDTYTYYAFDMNGEIVSQATSLVDSFTNQEIEITGGFLFKEKVIYVSVDKYYMLNYETLKFDEITNYFANSNIENYIQGKFNFYFTGNGSQFYEMKNFDGETILSNISSVDFITNISDGCILKVTANGKTYTIPLLNTSNISETYQTLESYDYSADVSNDVESFASKKAPSDGWVHYRDSFGHYSKKYMTVYWHWAALVYWTSWYEHSIRDMSSEFWQRGWTVSNYTHKGEDHDAGYNIKRTSIPYYTETEIDVTVNHTVNSYYITFNQNGSDDEPTEGEIDNQGPIKYTDETTTIAPNNNVITRIGYEFLGWGVSKTQTYATFTASSKVKDFFWNSSYISNSAMKTDGNTFTLYAIWKPREYMIQYYQDTEGDEQGTNTNFNTGTMKNSSGMLLTDSYNDSFTQMYVSEEFKGGGMRLTSDPVRYINANEEPKVMKVKFGDYFNAGVVFKVGYHFEGWIVDVSNKDYYKFCNSKASRTGQEYVAGSADDVSYKLTADKVYFKNLVSGEDGDNIVGLKPVFSPAQFNITFNFGSYSVGTISAYYLDGEKNISTTPILSSIKTNNIESNWYAGVNPGRISDYTNFIEIKKHTMNDLTIDKIYLTSKGVDNSGKNAAMYYNGSNFTGAYSSSNWSCTTSTKKQDFVYYKPTSNSTTGKLNSTLTKLKGNVIDFYGSSTTNRTDFGYINALFNKNSAYLNAIDTDGDTIVGTKELSGWMLKIKNTSGSYDYYYFNILEWASSGCQYVLKSDGTTVGKDDPLAQTASNMSITDVIIKNLTSKIVGDKNVATSSEVTAYKNTYKSNKASGKDSYYTLEVYACYQDRSYIVDFQAQPSDGATPLNGNELTELNDTRENHTFSQAAQYAYYVVDNAGELNPIGEDPYYSTSISNLSYTLGLGKTLTFEIRLKDFNDLPTGLYDISRVEIKNYPYYWKSDGTYGTTTIVILFETTYQTADSGKKNRVLSVKKVYAENGKEVKYGYDSSTGVGKYIYAISSNYDIASGSSVKWNKVYNKINIDLSEINNVGQENGVKINIYNCNLAGDRSLEPTDSGYINTATVGATGDKGFLVDVYSAPCFITEHGKTDVTQNWKDDGDFSSGNDKLSNYAENSEYSVQGEIKNKDEASEDNNFTTTQFVHGTENWLVYKVFIGEDKECYIWLNGEEYKLEGLYKDNKYLDYKRFDSFKFRLPYTYSNRGEYTTEIRVVKYFRSESGTADQYMAYVKPHNALAPNYGTSTMMVFTPYQTLVSGYGPGATTLYEPNSYLSSLTIRNNSGSYIVDLDTYFYNDLSELKDLDMDNSANGIYQYADHLRFCNDEEGYDYITNPTPERLPVLVDSSNGGYTGFYFCDPTNATLTPTYYKIIGRKDITNAFDNNITVDGYSYYLYLGVDSKGFYRYFLFNVGDSTGLLRTEQKKVTAKFSKINHTLKVNSYTPGKDADDSGNLSFSATDTSYDSYYTNSMTPNTQIHYSRYRPKYSTNTSDKTAWITGKIMADGDSDDDDFKYINTQSKTLNMWPSETYQIKLSPDQGYLIDTISVKIKNSEGYHEILSLTLNKSLLGSGEVIHSNQFSYYSQNFQNGTMVKSFAIRYDINRSTHHELISKPNNSGNKFGIYPAETKELKYRTGNTKSSSFDYMNFESFYLFISNMYNDVQIDVTTLSYFEFAILEANSDVSLAGKENEKGLDIALAGGDNSANPASVSVAGSGGASIGNLSFAYYAKSSSGSYKNVQFADPAIIVEKFKEIIFSGSTPANAADIYKDFAERYRSYILGKTYDKRTASYAETVLTGTVDGVQYKYYKLLNDDYLKDKDLSLFTENFRITRNKDGSRVYYRLMFFGMAPVLRYGFSMYASGMDYSYKFTGAYYYGETQSRAFEKVDAGATANVYDNSTATKYYDSSTDAEKAPYRVHHSNGSELGEYLYITVRDRTNSFEGVLYNFFSVTETANAHKDKDFRTQAYILHNKFTLALTVDYNKITVNAVSKLNTSSTNYQDDNPFTKDGTWFNNVTVTNINFGANVKANKNTDTSKQFTNWQDNFKNKETNPQDGNKFLNGYTEINNVYGYGIHFRYYEIPGYYLEKLVFKTRASGTTTKLLNNLSEVTVAAEYDSSIIEKESSVLNFSYYIEYNQDYGFYDIYMYNKNQDFGDSLGSMATLASPFFGIEVYSKQYSIKVTYHSNINSTNMSSTGTLKWLSGSTTTQTIVYDRLTALTSSMSMTGYTFVGWASQTNQSGENRYQYNNGINEWDTSSIWKSIVSMNSAKDRNYFAYIEAPEGNTYGAFDDTSSFISFGTGTSNRDYLETNYIGYEFYTDRGYFITDTGYTDYFPRENVYKQTGEIRDYNEEAIITNNLSYSLRNESYNFWSAHTSTFVNNIGQNTPKYKVVNNAGSGQYHFDLYGIWKPNTYVVNLDANDIYYEMQGVTGSQVAVPINTTSTKVSFNKDASQDKQWWVFDASENSAFNELGTLMPGSWKNQNGIKNGLKLSSDVYSFYVTFDTNDWYVLASQKLQGTPYSATDFRTGTQSLKNFIIDRYGYSWLGWFTKKLERVFQVDSSGYYTSATHKTVDSERVAKNTNKYVLLSSDKYSASTEFVTLNYTNMCGASNAKLFEEYKEIATSHFAYYGEDKTKVASNLGLGSPNSNGVYSSTLYYYNPNINFYHYKTTNKLKTEINSTETVDNIYYFENVDYLNTYGGYMGNYFHDTYGEDKSKNITYYDTSINYNFLTVKTDPNDSNGLGISFYWGDNGKIKTFRYISVFAYWETNLYNVIADYRDIESLNNGSVTREAFGSTVAEKPAAGLKFVPAYFDDKVFADRLKMLLPTRVGYDFVGWSLEPNKSIIKVTMSPGAIEPNTDYGFDYVERLGSNSLESVQIKMDQNPLYKTDLIQTSQITLRVLVNGDVYIAEYVYEVSKNGLVEVSRFKIKYNTNDFFFDVKRVYSSDYKVSTFTLEGDSIDEDAIATYFGFAKSSTYQLNDSMKNYLYRKSVSDISGQVLNLDEILGTEYNEKLGDIDEDHFIFMFAAWKVQTFTINVSLNIGKEELLNLYDLDSEFAVGLYNNATTKTEPNALTTSLDGNTKYIGIKSSYTKQNVTRRFAEFAYTDIVANVQFEIPFDGNFSEAYMKVGNKTYSLEKLYATAAGYYFVNWCLTDEGNEFNSAESGFDKSSVLVSNNSNTSYTASSTNGSISLNYGESVEAENVKSIMYNRKFDFDLYNYLTVSSLNLYNTTNSNNEVTGTTSINKTQDIQIHVGTKANINASLNEVEEFYEWYDGTSYSAGNKVLEKANYDYIENVALNSADYNEGNVKYKINAIDPSFYETVEYSNNLSTNFGYIIEGGRPFSICVEPVISSAGYQMYYIKANGDKQYIVPWVDSTGSSWINQSQRTYFGNIGTKVLTFDETSMYFDSYVIHFYDLNRNNYSFAGKTFDKISAGEYGSTYGAYYVDKSYDKAQIKSIKLYFAKVDSYSQNIDTSSTRVDFALTKTRTFTMFARWEQKKDLAITMASGNNNQNNSANNKGLTGYYTAINTDGSMSNPDGRLEKDSSISGSISNTADEQRVLIDENNVKLGYHFYDDLDLFIAPYFNGRFLNEIKLTFYDYEDVTLGDGINITTNFKKVMYELILQFNWNANTHQIQLYKWDLRKDSISIVTGNEGYGIYDKYKPSYVDQVTDNNNRIIPKIDKNIDPETGTVYTASDYEASNIRITEDFGHSTADIDKSTDLISIFYILSIIDQNIFGIATNDTNDADNNLLEIMGYHNDYVYQFDYESQSKLTSPYNVSGSNSVIGGDGRIDVNPVKMKMTDIMSSVDIQCRFSVQTYSLEVYNVFDPKEDNLDIEPDEVPDKKYTISNFGSIIALLGKTESAYRSTIDGLMYGSVNVGDNNHIISTDLRYVKSVPTISRNTGLSSTLGNVTHSYNVPYGTYLYGQYYKETSRPVDEEYNPNKRTGYNPSIYAGYDYIYANSYYTYGKSGDKITKGSFGDRKYSQSVTVLGSNTIYANSFREPSSLYTFETWLVPQSWAYPNLGTDTSGSGDLYLYEYNKAREASSMNRNTTIIGYYYATDQPKDIKFYTWQDKTNSYELYEGNQEEYTLQSSTSALKLDISGDSAGGGDGISVVVKGQNYIASGEPLVLSSYEKYGINGEGFNKEKFSLSEIYNNPTNVGVLENNIIRNFWYYENYVYNLFINKTTDDADAPKYDAGVDELIYCRRVVIDEIEGIVENRYYINNDENRRINLYSTGIDYTQAIIYAHETYSESRTKEQVNSLIASHSTELKEVYSFINYINPRTNTDRRFTGSNSYHLVRAGDLNDIDKYYPISPVENYISDFTKYYGENQATWPQKIKDYCDTIEKMGREVEVDVVDDDGNVTKETITVYDARFYVIFDGDIYFMVLSDTAVVPDRLSSIKQFYRYVPIYEKDAEGLETNVITGYRFEATADEANIENIDNQFLRIEDDFYQVNYIARMDNSGSYYYSPYTFKNTYGDSSGDLLRHYDYYMTNNSYINFNGEIFFFNSNTKKFYKVMKSKVVAGQIAETRLYEISAEDLGATSLIEVIYSTYSPVNTNYTVKVTEDDQKQYWKYKCVNVNNLPGKNIGYWYPNQSYGYVGYVNITSSDLAYISDISDTFNPTKVDLIDPTKPYNEDVSKVTKSYANERIYDKLKALVDSMGYTEAQKSTYQIDKIIQDTCGMYAGINTNGSMQLLSNLITVGQFFTENGSNLITAVELNIPVEISLPDPSSPSTILTLSVSIKYYVEMISRNTEISETIYAVPIYSKNIIEFREGAVTGGTSLDINLNKMDYSYFENRGNMYTYYYNEVDGNLLNFAVVSKAQMDIIKSSESYTDKLNEFLNKKDSDEEYIVPRVAQTYVYGNTTTSTQVTLSADDLAGLENGTYYLIAYYQKLVTSESGTVGEYVIRMGDNVVEMKLTSGSFSNLKMVTFYEKVD